MAKKLCISILITAVVTTGCATGYGPRGSSGGYEDFDLGNGRFMVEFYGNGFTHRAEVQQMALQRAREVCPEHGFSGGDVLDVNAEVNPSLYTSTSYGQTHAHVVKKATAKVLVQCK